MTKVQGLWGRLVWPNCHTITTSMLVINIMRDGN